MELEIPGQLRGPECRVIMKSAIAIRKELAPMFQRLEFKGASKLSLILRVGGSLGEFEEEAGDGQPYLEEEVLACDVLIRNHDWTKRSDEEIRSILASHLRPAMTECCSYLNLSSDATSQVLSTLAQQSVQPDRA